MAGSYLHLHLAVGAFPRAFGVPAVERPREGAAFLAGALGPDLGFFPGGPGRFSLRVHHEHTGDLVRALLAAAADPVEVSYAAGWALHVFTDLATHPLINLQADGERRRLSRQPAERLDLWHKRVEWGLDCHVIEVADHRPPLWQVTLHFPTTEGGDGLLARAARPFFPEDADEGQLRRGWTSTQRWIRRLAPLFCWTGSCRPAGQSALQALAGAGLRPLAAVAGRALQARVRWEDRVAVLSPLRPDGALAARVLEAADLAVTGFLEGWSTRFADLENLDLDTGEPAAGGRGG